MQWHLNYRQTKEIFIDFSIPKEIETIKIQFRNPNWSKSIVIDNLVVETFEQGYLQFSKLGMFALQIPNYESIVDRCQKK